MRGTDGIGITVAEPLPLIAGLDKEKYQIGNQSCSLRGFEIFGGLWIGPPIYLFTYL